MATYNGERYLQDQLESLARQTLLPYELVIGDDGSSDKTMAILQEFRRNAPFPVHITQNSQRLGFADNFLHAASLCEGEWIAFCDQDDVWLPEKLETISKAIDRLDRPDLMLLTHTARMVNSDLSFRDDFQPYFPQDKTIGPNGHRGFWVLPGFSCTVRGELITKLDWKKRPSSYDRNYPVQPHDKWICLLANALGSVHYISKQLALYRRHGSALTGFYEDKPFNQQIELSKTVGADHYSFLSDVALESADILSTLARTCNEDWGRNLMTSSLQLRKLARVYGIRTAIYSSKGFSSRLANFTKLLLGRGYFGNRFCSLGVRSMCKDAYHCVRNGAPVA